MEKGKPPMVNMVIAKVQQVTIRSKTKQSELEIQEAVQKATKEWVNEANNKNVAKMLEENNEQNEILVKSGMQQEKIRAQSLAKDESWKVLVDCQIRLPLGGLLKSVPLCTENVAHIITKNEFNWVSMNFTNLIKGPTIMDEYIILQ